MKTIKITEIITSIQGLLGLQLTLEPTTRKTEYLLSSITYALTYLNIFTTNIIKTYEIKDTNDVGFGKRIDSKTNNILNFKNTIDIQLPREILTECNVKIYDDYRGTEAENTNLYDKPIMEHIEGLTIIGLELKGIKLHDVIKYKPTIDTELSIADILHVDSLQTEFIIYKACEKMAMYRQMELSEDIKKAIYDLTQRIQSKKKTINKNRYGVL